MRYIFAGYPRSGIHAGGLEDVIEVTENLAVLEHDPAVQYRKEGRFITSPSGGVEQTETVEIHLSDRVIQHGITDNWFDDNTCFGNGVGISKSTADYEVKEVNHECGRTWDEIMDAEGFVDISKLVMVRVHDFTEGWSKYEARWKAGYCPQKSHVVNLTSILTKHELSAASYRRILALVEEEAVPLFPEAYETPEEPGKYKQETTTFTPGSPSASSVDVDKLIRQLRA